MGDSTPQIEISEENRLDHQVLGVLISNTSWQILIYLWKSGGVLGRVPAMYDIAMNRWWQRDPQLINIENNLVNVLMDMKWHVGKHMVSSNNSDPAICCNVVLRLPHTIWNDLNFLTKSGGKKHNQSPLTGLSLLAFAFGFPLLSFHRPNSSDKGHATLKGDAMRTWQI